MGNAFLAGQGGGGGGGGRSGGSYSAGHGGNGYLKLEWLLKRSDEE